MNTQSRNPKPCKAYKLKTLNPRMSAPEPSTTNRRLKGFEDRHYANKRIPKHHAFKS